MAPRLSPYPRASRRSARGSQPGPGFVETETAKAATAAKPWREGGVAGIVGEDVVAPQSSKGRLKVSGWVRGGRLLEELGEDMEILFENKKSLEIHFVQSKIEEMPS